MTFYDKVQESAQYVESRCKEKPTIGIILGSGLGSLVDMMEDKVIIPYKDIPGFR